MAGTLKIKNLQLGDNVTATQNFVLSENSDGTAKLARGNVGGTTQDILTVDAAGKVALPNTVLAGTGPCFSAYRSTGQVVPANSYTKVLCDAKEFDVTGAYDSSSNYRFQPSIAGYYQIDGAISMSGQTSGGVLVSIYKNGVVFKQGTNAAASVLGATAVVSGVIYLNGTSDYTELYVYDSGAFTTNAGASGVFFQGFLARAA